MLRVTAGKLIRAGRVGLLPAAFSPPTTAHVALAETAQRRFALDQVVQVLPERLPHKRIERPSILRRLEWLAELAGRRPGWAVCTCADGLVIDIVDAFRAELGPACEFFVIAGSDAARRYASWDYSGREPFAEQIKRFRLLVARRGDAFDPCAAHAGRITAFEVAPCHAVTSSSGVRDALASGGPWRHLVPPEIAAGVAAEYGAGRA